MLHPFRVEYLSEQFPGRCPGLVCHAPLGLSMNTLILANICVYGLKNFTQKSVSIHMRRPIVFERKPRSDSILSRLCRD